jgi:hypothetical protein
LKKIFDFLDKWLSPSKQVTDGEDVADTLVLFAIIVLLLVVALK